MNYDVDVIRICEGSCGAFEASLIKMPFRRGNLPYQFGEFVAVLFVTPFAPFSSKIILVPPLQLISRPQGDHAGSLVTDKITTYRYQGFTTLRPKCSDNGCGSCSPIKTRNDGFTYMKCIHQINNIHCDC